ncbi:MAG: P-type conjugative transfer protein TrbJ [Hyphomicrobiaceae bacterium]
MTRIPKRLLGLIAAAAIVCTAPANALTVFDPLNYQQNLLTAARSLDQIQNQIRQLESEAAQLMRMDRNLQSLSGTISPDLQSTLSQLRTRLGEGDALALKVQETDAAYARLYPTSFSATLSGDELTRAAKSRWDETYAGFRRSALIQGQVADSAETDARLLDQILTRSNGSVGALQATQAGNELSALHVKQSLQLQTLLAAQTRAETTDRARTLVAQQQARDQFKSFLGDGRAYTRGQ